MSALEKKEGAAPWPVTALNANNAQKHLLTVAAEVLAECQPQDLHEARLNLQAHNLFYQGMYYLDQAKKADRLPWSEFYMKSALKFIRLHTETVETINRYKPKGE